MRFVIDTNINNMRLMEKKFLDGDVLEMWKRYIERLNYDVVIRAGWVSDKINFIKKNVPIAKRVLEIGCANGRWLRLFERIYACEVFGIDNEICGLPSVKNPVLGDAFHLPFKHNSFDVVCAFGLIEHFKHPYPILVEAKRVLQPNGHLIITTPNMDISLNYFNLKLICEKLEGLNHYRIHSKKVIKFLKKLNLKNIRYNFYGQFFWSKFPFLNTVTTMLLRTRWPNNRITAEIFIICGEKRSEWRAKT